METQQQIGKAPLPANTVRVTIEKPDGTTDMFLAPAKQFSSGNVGYFTQLFLNIGGVAYGGQVQVWRKGYKA